MSPNPDPDPDLDPVPTQCGAHIDHKRIECPLTLTLTLTLTLSLRSVVRTFTNDRAQRFELNQKDNQGRTPLMLACIGEHVCVRVVGG